MDELRPPRAGSGDVGYGVVGKRKVRVRWPVLGRKRRRAFEGLCGRRVPKSQVRNVVQSGDTLGLIAANFGTTVDALIAANGLADANYLYVGQQLVIPGAAAPQTQAAASVQTVSDTTNGGGGQVHTVQSGDTLFAIAGQYGSSVDAIMGANGLTDPDYLYVGQQLTIP